MSWNIKTYNRHFLNKLTKKKFSKLVNGITQIFTFNLLVITYFVTFFNVLIYLVQLVAD